MNKNIFSLFIAETITFRIKYFAKAFLTEISFQGVSNQVGKFRKFQGLGEGECQTPPGGAGGDPKTKVPSVGVGGGMDIFGTTHYKFGSFKQKKGHFPNNNRPSINGLPRKIASPPPLDGNF